MADDPIVIDNPAQAAILLHLLDDLAAVLDMASQVRPPNGGRSTTYAANLAEEVRDIRAGLRRPEDDGSGMGYGAREWREALCAALDKVPLQQAGLAAMYREQRGEEPHRTRRASPA